ncbi:MAG: zf-HC2 domain-containing protein [Microlunatus sp.]|nr:zf-HC2 domain-containing protein [Microlunatus sp.]
MKLRSCQDFAEARSAYVDGYLGEAERQALLRHLSDCSSCRDEIAALQRLRSLLTDTGRQAGALVPDQLAHRLAAIAEHDAEAARQSARAVRFRIMSIAGVALLLVLVTGVGYVAAPAEQDAIADPAGAVRADFSTAVAQLPLTSPAVAAAVAVDPQRLRTQDSDLPPDPRMAGPNLDSRQLDELLRKAEWASDRVSYAGVQRIVAPRDDRTTAADVSVVSQPGTGSTVTVQTLAGRPIASGLVPTPAASRIAAGNLIAALGSGYRLTGTAGGTVAGRQAARVEAWRPAPDQQLAAAWWIDTGTGLVLRQELYDHAGRLVLSARYTSIAFGTAPARTELAAPRALASTALLARPMTTASYTTASAAALSSKGWFCQDELAGMQLVRLRADASAEPGVLHMVYTDGLSTVSVFERRGRLTGPPAESAWDPNLRAYRTDAMLNTASWQSGDVVFTVATDGSTSLRDRVVHALPHTDRSGRTTMERVRAGWSRILHAMG